MARVATVRAGAVVLRGMRRQQPQFLMVVLLLVLGFFLLYPVLQILILSFNTSPYIWFGERQWGLDNWRLAFQEPLIFRALGNTVMIWVLVVGISFPIATGISWVLARTNIPMSHALEVAFWFSFIMPGIATTMAWIALLDPRIGFINQALAALPFIEEGPFNIFSVPGIVWAHLMANGISTKVMILTPAFRNMDSAMEEAARVSGASNLRTMLRVTFPIMAAPIVLILSLQVLRILSGFEIEYLLGTPIGFFVYSTMLFQLVQQNSPPLYGQATVLGSLTLMVVALIIPMQRWVVHRRRYTTITASFRPGLLRLGYWRYVTFVGVVLLLFGLTFLPLGTLILNSFMTRSGFFNINPPFTFDHWVFVFTAERFYIGLWTTLRIGLAAAIGSPLLFIVIAYIVVRTRLRGRILLDMIIWGSSVLPGLLTGLGLLLIFLGTPGLSFLFGSIWALIIVVVLAGNTTGVNISKGVLVQLGAEMEEAARVSGAGWTRTFVRIVIPVFMPTLLLLSMMNFAQAAGTTASIILLASRGTTTLSLLALEWQVMDGGYEIAGILGLFLMLLVVVPILIVRWYTRKLTIRHH